MANSAEDCVDRIALHALEEVSAEESITFHVADLGLDGGSPAKVVLERVAEVGKKGACHMFRHTVGTLLHEQGMDIRHIQALLGHEEISTTQIYTQVSNPKLKEVHTALHPGKLPQPGQFPIIEGRQPA